VAGILEVVSLYREKLELEVALFNDHGEENNLILFELIVF
jgi:hypothetical protein